MSMSKELINNWPDPKPRDWHQAVPDRAHLRRSCGEKVPEPVGKGFLEEVAPGILEFTYGSGTGRSPGAQCLIYIILVLTFQWSSGFWGSFMGQLSSQAGNSDFLHLVRFLLTPWCIRIYLCTWSISLYTYARIYVYLPEHLCRGSQTACRSDSSASASPILQLGLRSALEMQTCSHVSSTLSSLCSICFDKWKIRQMHNRALCSFATLRCEEQEIINENI